MARKSLKKRKEKYRTIHQESFKEYQDRLKRLRTRLRQGYYPFLFPPEIEKIERLLFDSILEDWTIRAMLAGLEKPRSMGLRTSRLCFDQITAIIRGAGNRKRPKIFKPATVLRRNGQILNTRKPRVGNS